MKIIVDFSKFKTKKELYKYIKQALHFPDYFSNNLDSLYDLLCEVDKELYLEFLNIDEGYKIFGDFIIEFLYTFKDSKDINKHIHFLQH